MGLRKYKSAIGNLYLSLSLLNEKDVNHEKFVIFMLISFSILIFSCQKGNEVKKPEPEILFTKIYLWAGTDTTVAISKLKTEGKNFTLHADNNEVAKVITDGQNITITSYKPGKVNVTLTNEQNKTFKILVQPVDMLGYNIGYWVSISRDGYKSYVTVKTNDQKLTDSLYNALWNKIDDKGAFGRFKYYFEVNKFGFVEGSGSNGYAGTWGYEKLMLTLSYNDKKELYQVIPIPPYLITTIELKKDLTNEIKTLFPDKGVIEVTTHQFFVRYITPG